MNVLPNVVVISGHFPQADVEAVFSKNGCTFQSYAYNAYFVTTREGSTINTTDAIVAGLQALPISFVCTHIGVKTGSAVLYSSAVPNIDKIINIVTG